MPFTRQNNAERIVANDINELQSALEDLGRGPFQRVSNNLSGNYIPSAAKINELQVALEALGQGPYTRRAAGGVIDAGNINELQIGIEAEQVVKAFPGAEGFGADVTGGRGGVVVAVTNLNNTGAGSLRNALLMTVPRIIVFTIGGTIQHTSACNLTSAHSNLTILGQTAPGGGITLRPPTGSAKAIKFDGTSNVIIRYMRFRSDDATSGWPGREAFSSEGAGVVDAIFDHCSFSWGVDETIGMAGDVKRVTFSWCLVAEGLHDTSASGNPDAPHSNGMLFSGKDGIVFDSKEVTVHHCLFPHNWRRSPRYASSDRFQAVNNVIYNYNRATMLSDYITVPANGDAAKIRANIVGNYYKAGADGGNGASDWEVDVEEHTNGKRFDVYLSGNIGPHRTSDAQAEDLVMITAGRTYVVGTPHSMPTITTTSAAQAYTDVLADAGCRFPHWDAADSRVVTEVTNGTGVWKNTVAEAGGFPSLAAGSPPTDTDGDGIPDTWETANGLNPNNAADSDDIAPDGYAWIEKYANSLV